MDSSKSYFFLKPGGLSMYSNSYNFANRSSIFFLTIILITPRQMPSIIPQRLGRRLYYESTIKKAQVVNETATLTANILYSVIRCVRINVLTLIFRH